MTYLRRPTNLDLKFDVNAICQIELLTRKKIGDIVEEMQSPSGISMNVLRAVVAAGHLWRHPLAKYAGPIISQLCYDDEHHAGKLIAKVGVAVATAHVGERLGEALRSLSEAA